MLADCEQVEQRWCWTRDGVLYRLIWKWLCAGQWHLESKDSVAVGVARALWPDFTSESRPPFGGPFEQRITSPVADARDLQKRRIAQR